MKTLDRKIEEDITQVGQNNSYPTQIVINLDDLKPIDETHWQVGDTDIILTGQKHFLTTTIDGIQYCTLTKYDDEESKLNDTYPQLGNHIGLCVNKIAKETIEEGIKFVEKAIREERQFITSEGEVIEIEVTKEYGKEQYLQTVHRLRNSNYILCHHKN